MSRISDGRRRQLYGEPGRGRYSRYATPWRYRGNPIHVMVHQEIYEVFDHACHQAAADVQEWKPQRIDSLAVRPTRGGSTPSIHSYALAFDFFATGPNVPPPGGVWTPDNPVPPAFARCFTDLGFTWGATWAHRPDLPHIEWAAEPPSDLTRPTTKEEGVARFNLKGTLQCQMMPNDLGLAPFWGWDEMGNVYAFNGAPFHGSLATIGESRSDIVGMMLRLDRPGYVLVSSSGEQREGRWICPTFSFPL